MLLERRGQLGRPLVVGHRGASGHAPENTYASFERALELGADMVECDVHLSRDGVPVVLHDHTLDRTTSGRGLVVEHTAAEIAALDAGSWKDQRFRGEHVPTLDGLLGWLGARAPLQIELKNGPIYYPGLEEKVVDLVHRHAALDRVVLISFDHQALLRAKSLEPRIACGALYAALLVDGPSVARASGADALLPHVGMVTADVVDEAHRAGLAVGVWTVNDDEELALARTAGVDAIATDYPDRMLAALG